MGKPTSEAEALSMHAQDAIIAGSSGSSSRRFLDDDDDAAELIIDDELPPLYSDVVEGDAAALAASGYAEGGGGASAPLLPPTSDVPSGDGGILLRETVHAAEADGGKDQPSRAFVMPAFDDDAALLAANIRQWAVRPPRPYVRLYGSHSETTTSTSSTRNGHNKTETRTQEVVDFDVKVELTPWLYAAARMQEAWRTLRPVENADKTRRGTVFRCQAPGVKERARHLRRRGRSRHEGIIALDTEQGLPAGGSGGSTVTTVTARPDLDQWCQRYCDDRSLLKCFTVKRRMTGFDYGKVRRQMAMLVKQTNYRGRLQVSFPVDDAQVDIYNGHRFNRWRLVRFYQLLCALTLLLLFTWPFLFFRTKRYEVVTADWAFSRPRAADGRKEYVSLSEDQLYNLWGRAITRAVLEKRITTLDQADLRAAEGAEPTFHSAHPDGLVDGLAGVMQASINAMNNVNRQLGWGGDC